MSISNIKKVSKDGKEEDFKWKATIMGPPNTPYQGGMWDLRIEYNNHLDFFPDIIFESEIYHCNVSPIKKDANGKLSGGNMNSIRDLKMYPSYEDLVGEPTQLKK